MKVRYNDRMTSNKLSHGVVHTTPPDMRTALMRVAAARTAWEDITPLARNEWICWVVSVKKDETRREHIRRMISQLQEGKRRPCCWAGCGHR